jgi:outer membrane protein OmpA-like peptidoglycan-associated protein
LFDSRNFQPELSSLDKPFEVVAELDQIKVDQVVQLRNLFFDIDKFDLKPESETELKVVINLLKANPKMRILISGHTDNTGSEVHNKTLSENRANAVKNYLVNAGIDAGRLQSKGFGSSQPMESNDTDAGKARNRRIEMKILQIN